MWCALRNAAVLVLGLCIVGPSVCLAQTESVSTVQVSPTATQKYTLLVSKDDPKTVLKVWVLFTGYDGYAHVGLLDSTPVFIGRGIMVDGRRLFLRDHTAVAVVDSPSNMSEMTVAFRRSDAYLSGTQKLIEEIHTKLPAAKIYLVGASNGSVSVVQLASRMPERIAGVAVLSGLYTDPEQFKGLTLYQPIVFVHHEKDACLGVHFTSAFRERFHPVMVSDIGVHYASTCGPYSAHHFHGQEAAVVDLLYQWADGQPSLPTSIR
jgi:predicted esterase